MTTEENQVEWINVAKRVPDDRRRVLAWGEAGFCVGGYQPLRAQFLGVTAFNPSPSGGRFDVECYKRFSVCHCHVTHWAELEGPNEEGLV